MNNRFYIPVFMCFLFCSLLLSVFFAPEVMASLELSWAYTINGLLGHSQTFDQWIIFFNQRRGDAVMAIAILALFAISMFGMAPAGNRSSSLYIKISSFITHGIYLFSMWLLLHFFTEGISRLAVRPSPSYDLAVFKDLAFLYGEKVKTHSLYSFPSNHGVVFFSLWWFLFFQPYHLSSANRITRLIVFTLLIVMAMPRVVIGAHWPLDMLGSFTFCATAFGVMEMLGGKQKILAWLTPRVSLLLPK